MQAGIPKPDSAIWAMIGVTPKIGQNDVMEEFFTLMMPKTSGILLLRRVLAG